VAENASTPLDVLRSLGHRETESYGKVLLKKLSSAFEPNENVRKVALEALEARQRLPKNLVRKDRRRS